MSRSPHRATRWTHLGLALLLVVAGLGLGCNVIDIALGRHAKIERMVPGGHVATGELECWLELEFSRYPSDVDLRDVRVRFESIALARPAEFDWRFIASNDVLTRGGKFGAGHQEAAHTDPRKDPPLGQPSRVKFPLRARRVVENAPSTIYLEAELWWGGERQHTMRKTIEHVYSRSEGGFF